MSEIKTVLVTGSSTGIGRNVAEELRNRGYRVFATARKSEDVLELREKGFDSLQLDLANTASIHEAVKTLLHMTEGKLYALFNNGAYGQPGAVEDLEREVLRDQFEVNFFGTHELTRLVIPVMREQGYGRIIQNSSLLGYVALKYRGAYNASKFALEGLTDTLRLELEGTGIFVSLIEPGPIESEFRKNAYKAWLRNINKEKSYHNKTYAILEERLQTEGPVVPFTLGPDAVTKKVIHALESKRPKARYPVTFPAYLFAFLKRTLPGSVLDNILARI